MILGLEEHRHSNTGNYGIITIKRHSKKSRRQEAFNSSVNLRGRSYDRNLFKRGVMWNTTPRRV